MFYSISISILTAVVLNARASTSQNLTTTPLRDPAQAVEGKNLKLKCTYTEQTSDIYEITVEGSVQHKFETKGFPMVRRSPIVGNWLSRNTVVLNGKWQSDEVCGGESHCEYRFFTFFFNLKSGTAHEITTYFYYPESTWKSEDKTINCQVLQ